MLSRPVIRLSSVTYAIRAQKLLEQHGIKCYIKKLARDISANGCGYGLEINGNVNNAVSLLQRAGIRVTEIIGG